MLVLSGKQNVEMMTNVLWGKFSNIYMWKLSQTKLLREVLMKRKCTSCHKNTLTLGNLFILSLGFRVKCSNCSSKLETHTVYHCLLQIFLVLLTVFLLGILGNLYGMFGIILAFIVPVIIEFSSIYWMPIMKAIKLFWTIGSPHPLIALQLIKVWYELYEGN